MKKSHLIFALKAILLLVVAGWVGNEIYKALNVVGKQQLAVDWRWGILSVSCFCASMITSALVWRWLAWKMGDRGPTARLLGAYTYSQLGKYIPGKVVLLLMRVERSGRFGMSASICTLATLLENALYMVSGGIAGMLAIFQVAAELKPHQRIPVWIGSVGGVIVLSALCVPTIFYGLVNRLLKKMNKPEVAPESRLAPSSLLLAMIAFFPCWIFGGLALWGSVQAVNGVALLSNWWFAGAFALGVIVGMASLLPGGTGIREAVLYVAVSLALRPVVGPANAAVLAALVAVLQRLFQIAAEILLGLMGMWMTRKRKVRDTASVDDKQPRVVS